MSKLVISNLRHRNSENFSVSIDHLEVEAGKIVCLLGPSGCGKSTTLRLAAGLENPDEGEIFIGEERVAGKGEFVSAEDRQIGLVFQDYALFPHLTVLGNVLFGIREGTSKDRKRIAAGILDKMGLAEFADKYPHMLSGGEQQRVALARALAPNPRIILMDEPFSGLDVVLRNRVRDDTLSLLKETGTTVLLVTHDPEEAMRMADQIVLMRDGKIEQQGTPSDLYSRPKSEFVASFLGDVNRVKAVIRENEIETELGNIALTNPAAAEGDCEILVRPEAIRLSKVNGKDDPTAVVLQSRNLGPFILIDLELPSGGKVTARAASILQPEDGETCSIALDRRQVFLFAYKPS